MMNLLKILSCLIGDRPLLKVIFNVLSWDFGRDTACHGLRPAVTDANHDPREAGVKCVLYQ